MYLLLNTTTTTTISQCYLPATVDSSCAR